MAPPEPSISPNHPLITPDTHCGNIPRGTKRLSQNHQTSSNPTPTSKHRKFDAITPQTGKRHDPSPFPRTTDHLNRQPITPHSEGNHPPQQPRSETRDATAKHLPRPAEYPPMARWRRETVQQEPWNSTSRLHADDVERARGVQSRSGSDLISKDERRVTSEATTSSRAAGYRDGVSEAGACVDLMGVGAWLI